MVRTTKKYINIGIDVFSKMAYAAPMKKMNEFDSTIAMESIINKLPDIPQNIITDLGTEYYNSKIKALFDRYGINHYSIRGKHKACVAERFIRTLKGRLEKYFFENKTHNWINVLDQFIANYNNSYHRSIKMEPINVNEDNKKKVFNSLYPKSMEQIRPRLNKGDQVRLLKDKNIFEKGYTRSWSLEIYKIEKTFSESTVDFYLISDSAGNILPRKKYYWELNLVTRNVD
jgi:glutamate 5-kinase